jgi:hypothetical protein
VHVPASLGSSKRGLRVRVARAPKESPHGQPQPAGDGVCLIEAAGPLAPAMQRHRHDGVRPREHGPAVFAHQGGKPWCHRSPAVVLQGVHQLTQRVCVGAECTGNFHDRRAGRAPGAVPPDLRRMDHRGRWARRDRMARIRGRCSVRRERLAARGAIGWGDEADRSPARFASCAARGLLRDALAHGAGCREKGGKQTVDRIACMGQHALCRRGPRTGVHRD